jgi:hypothetical protein
MPKADTATEGLCAKLVTGGAVFHFMRILLSGSVIKLRVRSLGDWSKLAVTWCSQSIETL